MKPRVVAIVLAALAAPAQASPEWGAPRPPTEIFAEHALDTLGDTFLDQLAAPRQLPSARAASLLPEPDGYALLLSGLGLLLYRAHRRRRALHS